ncbi:type IV toxin-antitoxin system AbiEi family antitoxin domain-containing protein [Micromonospora sp. NPDC050417]|uniref:type IV toxin-antitoxin system AbiEi family antitoxin domain-containing protein n=1 Tax=Micromonospora sp. NPDC050417 TaxID=3364280 RepID=UPI0037955812
MTSVPTIRPLSAEPWTTENKNETGPVGTTGTGATSETDGTAQRGPVQDLETTAARQQQIVSRAQLLSAGVSDMQIYRRVRQGRWQRPLPGTYSLVTGVLTDEQRRIAAALYTGRDGQITAVAALHWYGFRYVPTSDRVQLIVPHHSRRKSAGYVNVARALTLDSRARDAGLYRVCSPARAVVDAARDMRDLRTVRTILAEAIQRDFTDLPALDGEIRRARRSRTALVRRAFAEVVDGVRSAPEAELRECLAGSEVLPEIRWNPRLGDRSGARLPSPDGWIDDAAIALEVDSREFHFTPTGWANTLRRNNELGRHGALVLHFTPAQIRQDPDLVRRTVEDAYRSRQGSRPPCSVLLLPEQAHSPE